MAAPRLRQYAPALSKSAKWNAGANPSLPQGEKAPYYRLIRTDEKDRGILISHNCILKVFFLQIFAFCALDC
ncbi:Hypothetical protein BIBO2_0309 [Brucella sp. BO2]|nr:Hypothetical protein BIBO2_0309 [Brucella sp. BO2]